MKEAEKLKKAQKQFVIEMLNMQMEKPVYFLDETSTHLWEKRVKTFSKLKEPVMLSY